MFAHLGCTLEHRFPFSSFHQVVDSHVAVVEAHRHQVRVLLVNVQAHDARTGGVDVLWKAMVL